MKFATYITYGKEKVKVLKDNQAIFGYLDEMQMYLIKEISYKCKKVVYISADTPLHTATDENGNWNYFEAIQRAKKEIEDKRPMEYLTVSKDDMNFPHRITQQKILLRAMSAYIENLDTNFLRK